MKKEEIEVEILKLNQELERLNKEFEDEIKKSRENFKKIWTFQLVNETKNFEKYHYQRLMDENIRHYLIKSTLHNVKEAKELGIDTSAGNQGFLYNSLSGKLILNYGGGYMFIPSNPNWNASLDIEERKEDFNKTIKSVEDFITRYPDGGDVTELIVNQKFFSWK